MASIERTVYPRLKRNFIRKELSEIYTPTAQEIEFARSVTRGSEVVSSFAVSLKIFQRLGYFLTPSKIPAAIVKHVGSCFKVPVHI